MQYAVLVQLLGVIALHMKGMEHWSDMVQISSVGELGLLISTTLTAYVAIPERAKDNNSINPARFSGSVAIVLAVLLGGAVLTGCGPKARHIVVVADNAVATAIFAVDDEWAVQCKSLVEAPTPAWCGQADTVLQKTLHDLDGITAMFQATPKNALTMPHGLPDLAADLLQLSNIVTPLADTTLGARLVGQKLASATARVDDLIRKLVGE